MSLVLQIDDYGRAVHGERNVTVTVNTRLPAPPHPLARQLEERLEAGLRVVQITLDLSYAAIYNGSVKLEMTHELGDLFERCVHVRVVVLSDRITSLDVASEFRRFPHPVTLRFRQSTSVGVAAGVIRTALASGKVHEFVFEDDVSAFPRGLHERHMLGDTVETFKRLAADLPQCPIVTSLTIRSDSGASNETLRHVATVVGKFPNLRTIALELNVSWMDSPLDAMKAVVAALPLSFEEFKNHYDPTSCDIWNEVMWMNESVRMRMKSIIVRMRNGPNARQVAEELRYPNLTNVVIYVEGAETVVSLPDDVSKFRAIMQGVAAANLTKLRTITIDPGVSFLHTWGIAPTKEQLDAANACLRLLESAVVRLPLEASIKIEGNGPFSGLMNRGLERDRSINAFAYAIINSPKIRDEAVDLKAPTIRGGALDLNAPGPGQLLRQYFAPKKPEDSLFPGAGV